MRQFIRHPATVPIEVSATPEPAVYEARDVSLGGLAFQAGRTMTPGQIVEVRIPSVRPPFAARARVVWCRPGIQGFELGVAFLEAADAFRGRMVEQVCHIQSYREVVNRQEGRKLSGREAAAEWIAKHAADFTDIGSSSAALISGRPSGRRAADQVGEVAREVTDRSADAARQRLQVVQGMAGAASAIQREVAHRSANQIAALSRTLVELTVAQVRENLETLSKLSDVVDWDQVANAVDWERVFRIQSGYLRTSLERAADLTRRYLELSQAVLTAPASAAQRKAKTAA